ncbi:reverse transcriptase domain-containing protein [Tanacetum coccineum]
MSCSLPHTDSEVEALVQKLIDEDNGLLYFKYLIDSFLKEGSDKDYELNLSMYGKAAKLEKHKDAKLAWLEWISKKRTKNEAKTTKPDTEWKSMAPPPVVEQFNLEEPIENPDPLAPMDDTRTMAQLLEAPTAGYEDAIVVPEITADNFELKHGLLNLVQNKQFFGHDKEDPHAHIRYFNKITSTMKFPNVPSTSVKLMLFPFSLEGAARIWLEKEPPRSIQTWDDLVSKFINKFFPPSKTTNLRNEITRFQQRFDETFYEAWDRFNDLLRACPHHGFSELHQLDTFYNALNSNDQDSLNSAAGGNFLDKMPRDCLRIIESKSKVRNSRNKPVVAKVSTSTSTPEISSDVAELKDMVKALLLDKKNQSPAPTPVKAVEESCVTCGGAHSYQTCPATTGNVYRDNIQEYVSQAAAANYNQGNTGYRAPISNQIRPPGFPPVQNNHNVQNQGNNQNRYNQNRNLIKLLLQPPIQHSNTVTNPKEDLKGITTRSGVAYKGPTIPITSSPKVVEREPEVTKDTMLPTNNGSTEDVQPPVVPVVHHESISEPVNAPVRKFQFPADFVVVDFEPDPRVPLILGRSFLKTSRALIDVYEGEITLRVGREAITFNLDQTSRYTANYHHMTANRIDVIDMACEEYSRGSSCDFLLFKEADSFLAIEDDPLNRDPSPPPPNQGNYFPETRKDLKICEANNENSSVNEPPEVELKDLPPHLEYAFFEGKDKLPIIIA